MIRWIYHFYHRTGREKGRVGDDQAPLDLFSLTGIDAVPPRQDSAIRSNSADRVWGRRVGDDQDGLLVDLRMMSREVQELAFAKGIIPYIPADGQDRS